MCACVECQRSRLGLDFKGRRAVGKYSKGRNSGRRRRQYRIKETRQWLRPEQIKTEHKKGKKSLLKRFFRSLTSKASLIFQAQETIVFPPGWWTRNSSRQVASERRKSKRRRRMKRKQKKMKKKEIKKNKKKPPFVQF